MTINTLKVTDLEFDTIKANLKEWMKTHSNFTDFEYEASGLSSMLDVLAYNTHYNAVLANFMTNEMFLDTALKRSSVVSHAKSLGYKPRSIVGSRAKVSITINSVLTKNGESIPDVFVIRRGTKFTTSVGNSTFQFVTLYDYSAARVGGTYIFPSIDLIQGEYNSYAWQVTSNEYSVKYVIPNTNVDTSTIRLEVYDTNTSINHSIWKQANTLLDIIDITDKIYFVQESSNSRHEIYFGNGVTSVLPQVGNVIRIEYITSSGANTNGVKIFHPQDSISHDGNSSVIGNVSVVTMQESVGGANIESISEIKHFASNHFAVQNRAVTGNDYAAIIRENFTNVAAIKVWGGEDNIPKHFGAVFICIKPHQGDYLTSREEKEISSFLAQKNIMNQKMIYVKPDYLYIIIDSTIYYTPSMVSSFTDIGLVVKSNITQYSTTHLEKFSEIFRHSALTGIIDSSDYAIQSNITKVKIAKILNPILNKNVSYKLNFGNRIKSEGVTVFSTPFNIAGIQSSVTFSNRGTDIIVGYLNSSNQYIVISKVGNIDYTTGLITITDITISSINTNDLIVSAIPYSVDIVSSENNICIINPTDITVNVMVDSLTNRNLVTS